MADLKRLTPTEQQAACDRRAKGETPDQIADALQRRDCINEISALCAQVDDLMEDD